MVVNVVLRYLLLKGLSQRLGEENEFRTTFTRPGGRNHFPKGTLRLRLHYMKETQDAFKQTSTQRPGTLSPVM